MFTKRRVGLHDVNVFHNGLSDRYSTAIVSKQGIVMIA